LLLALESQNYLLLDLEFRGPFSEIMIPADQFDITFFGDREGETDSNSQNGKCHKNKSGKSGMFFEPEN
jgi:hypothetical protein